MLNLMLSQQSRSTTGENIYFWEMLTKEGFFAGLDPIRGDNDKVVEFYDHIGNDYEKVMEEAGYLGSIKVFTDLLKKRLGEYNKSDIASLEILDVGCGSGRSGVELKNSGFQKIDGVDPSNMIDIAREKEVYRSLIQEKITETHKLSAKDSIYDGILCAGCFALGQIHPQDAIPEFLRILKKGGVAVYTVSPTLDFAETIQSHIPFIGNGTIEILTLEKIFYIMHFELPTYGQLYAIRKL